MAFCFGDVLLVPIVFSEGGQAKRRPVLLVPDTGDVDLLVVPITSHSPRGAEDVTLHEWRAAIRKLGQLANRDAQQARKALRRFLEAIS